MPQELYWVREKESHQAFQMHSVDAAEGLALGDYELIADPATELTPEERAGGASGGRSLGGTPHPELQTPEQRAETRRLAKEEADAKAQFISGPLGTPLVIPAGQSAPVAQRATPPHPAVHHDPPPAPARTPPPPRAHTPKE